MANTREAIENVKSLARTFQSVIDLASALDGVANLEQAINEQQSRLARLESECEKAVRARDAARAEALESAQAQSELSAAAVVRADKLVADAHAQAQAIVAGAQAAADALLNDTHKQVEQLRCAAKDMQDQRDAAQVELQDLEAKIERARAKMRDILGA